MKDFQKFNMSLDQQLMQQESYFIADYDLKCKELL